MARNAIRAEWDQNWAIYRGRYDFSKKAPWQSQVPVNKLAAEIRFAANELVKAVEIAGRFFTFDAHGDMAREPARISEKLTRHWMDHPDTLLRVNLAEGARSSMICGSAIFQLYWDQGFRLRTVDPYNFWLDPTGLQRFCIHRTYRDKDEIVALAKDGQYDLKVAESLAGDIGHSEEDRRRTRAGLRSSPDPSGRKVVEIWECWGDLIGTDGELLMENGWAVVAERKQLLKPPEENPFWHNRWPFVVVTPERDPFAPYGDPLMTDVAELAKLLTMLVNLSADAAFIDGIPVWQVNRMAMRFPDQAVGHIYPGKVFEANSSEPIVQAVQKGYSGAQVTLPVMDRVDTLIQNTTGLTQFLTGQAGSGPRRTATEVVYKGRQSGHLLESLASSFQNEGLARMAEMARDLIAQYQPPRTYMTPLFRDLLGEPAARALYSMSDADRYAFLCTRHSVRGRGVAAIFTRQEELSRVLQFLQLAEMAPEIRQLVDMPELIRKAIQSFGWEPEDILLSPEEVAKRQQAEMAQAAMMPPQEDEGNGQTMRGAGPRRSLPWQGPLEKPQSLKIPAVA